MDEIIKENNMTKLEELKSAIETLEGKDIEAIKRALTLIGEPVSEAPKRGSVRFDVGSQIKIAILQRGWVAIGRFSQDGDKFTLTDASTIRVWGTTKGIGELANGPLPSTKLDKAGTMTFERLTVVALIDVKDEVWNSKL